MLPIPLKLKMTRTPWNNCSESPQVVFTKRSPIFMSIKERLGTHPTRGTTSSILFTREGWCEPFKLI